MQVVAIPNRSSSARNEIGLSKKLMESSGLVEGDLVKVWNGEEIRLLYVRGTEAVGDDRVVLVPKTLIRTAANIKIEPSPETLLLGCDPEFILVDSDNGVKDASRVFSHEAQLGSDAALGELRPTPSNKVSAVVGYLRELIAQIPSRTKHIPIAMSWYRRFLCGFHIHIGLPSELSSFAFEYATPFIENLIRLFDYCVGIPALLRDKSDRRRLCHENYGAPGDYRLSRHTVEYRTPGGFHLRSPSLSRELLTASYVVAEDVLGKASLETRFWTRPNRFCSYEDFAAAYELPLNPTSIAEIMVSSSRQPALAALEKIHRQYEKLYGYNRASAVLTPFLSGITATDSPYMVDNWAIPSEDAQ